MKQGRRVKNEDSYQHENSHEGFPVENRGVIMEAYELLDCLFRNAILSLKEYITLVM